MKQSVIVGVYLMLLMLFCTLLYFVFKTPQTCFDAKQNQNETGIDCGGVCQAVCQEIIVGEPLEVKEADFVWSSQNRYDIVGKIYNPNGEVGAVSFTYTAALLDSAGSILVSRSGTGYILPQENKYVLALNLDTPATPASAVVHITDVTWAHFSGYQEKPDVSITQRHYNVLSSGAGFGEATGLLTNNSPYDFRAIVVQIILRDGDGKPLALNSTEMNTVRSHESRDFRLVWPTAFPGSVEDAEMVVDADIYHSDNFIKQYLPGGKFQDLAPAKR
jgi:hypothetical protein